MFTQTRSKRLIRFGVASAATVVLACTADTMMAPGKPQLDIGPAAQVVTTIITPVPVLVVHSPATIVGTYPVATAVFGPPLTAEGVTGDVIVALDPADALGPSPRDACSPLTNAAAVSGKIAMVDRGTCLIVNKVKHAQEAGAIAVIVANNVAGPPTRMAGDDPTITISSAMISLAAADLIKSALLTDVVNVTLQGPVADEELPVLTVPVNGTANAVSPAGAMVAYSATASDNFDPNPVLSCLPSSGTLFSIGATTVTCTATDATGNTASASFLVTIQGAEDQIGALILPRGASTRLQQKLDAAVAALASGEQNGACGQLKALINELNAQAGKKLTREEAATLIGDAERIRSVLGCSFVGGRVRKVVFDDPHYALPDIDCGDFIIKETSFSNRALVTTYFNDAGEPFRIRVHVQFDGVLTNMSTGQTLRDHAAFTNTKDFNEGTETETGVSFHYKIPHVGNVFDNGRIVFDLATKEILFEAGSHDVLGEQPFNYTAICPLLASGPMGL